MGMVALNCPNCGAEIELDDSREFGFCNYCGTKVMQDKVVVEHKGNVKIDKSEEKDNLKIAARNALLAGNYDYATNLYQQLTTLDPYNWEAQFFPLLIKSDSITNGEIQSYAQTISNSFDLVFSLINDHVTVEQERLDAIDDVVNMCYEEASSLLSASLAFRKSMNQGNTLVALTSITGAISSASSGLQNNNEDRARAVTICNIMWFCGDKIEKIFDMDDENYSKYAVLAWKKCNKLNSEFKSSRNAELFNNQSKVRLSKKINKYDKSYPIVSESKSSSGGCYVATAVYGSYDCPEVWTLRRYRDNQLAKSWYGRLFIHTYYAISPTLVKWFGNTQWFKNMWKPKLDSMVKELQEQGVENTPYDDIDW